MRLILIPLFFLLASISPIYATISPSATTKTAVDASSEGIVATNRLRGTVVLVAKLDVWIVYVRNGAGMQSVRIRSGQQNVEVSAGDEVEIIRTPVELPDGPGEECSIHILSHGPPPQPITPTVEEFRSGKALNNHIRARGVVRDAFRDEIDPDWIFFVLNIGGILVNATCPSPQPSIQNPQPSALSAYIGEEAVVTGVANSNASTRRFSGMVIVMSGLDAVEIAHQKNPFDVRQLELDGNGQVLRFEDMGRRRTSGHVLACWDKNMFLLKSNDGRVVTVQVANSHLPACDDHVIVSGLPETDYYRLILSHAVWKAQPSDRPAPQVSYRAISPSEILKDSFGRIKVNADTHGKAIQISGTVRHIPSSAANDNQLFVEADGHLVPVDLSHIPSARQDLQLDARISVSGFCLLEYENESIPNRFPRIKGFTVIPRSQDNIRILSRPSWWTPVRIWLVAGFLLLALIGVAVWNAALRRVAARKGRELAREQISRAEAELRIDERTRLAIELHDTLSQNLMGVAMCLDAVTRAVSPCSDVAAKMIATLADAIQYCRAELRQCLWDLRSRVLEERDMNEAIRQTLAPHVGKDAAIAIRFNVPRHRLTDQTVHAMIRIIRELALNAIRHGKATHVRIAGSLEDGNLLFSVADDGCGFDVTTVPSVREGHFGLQGIRERVNLLGGEMTVNSEPGNGTKITIRILAIHPKATT